MPATGTLAQQAQKPEAPKPGPLSDASPAAVAEEDPLPFAGEGTSPPDEERLTAARTADKYELRNMTDVLLHQLPSELFLVILLASIPWHHWSLNIIRDLAKVCRYWRRTVRSSALFWPEIDIKFSQAERELVLRKNPAGILTIRCTKSIEDRTKRKAFLEWATSQVDRMIALFFQGHLSSPAVEFLESSAPRLSELFVYQYDSDNAFQYRIPLSDGVNLRHIDLDFVTLPWESSRLSCLQTIQLRRITGDLPTVLQLHTILASSPRLTWFALAELQDGEDAATSSQQAFSTDDTISLPLLETIVLRSIPARYYDFVLSHIDAPACACVIVDSAKYDHFKPRSLLANAVQTAIAAGRSKMNLSYTCPNGPLHMSTETTATVNNEWMPWIQVTHGLEIDVIQSHSDVCVEDLAMVLLNFDNGKRGICSLDLVLTSDGADDTTPGKAIASPGFPVEAFGYMDTLTELTVIGNATILEVLAYLAKPRHGKAWPCSRLMTLHVAQWTGDQQSLQEALLLLNRRRESPGGSDTVERPVQISTLHLPSGMSDIELI